MSDHRRGESIKVRFVVGAVVGWLLFADTAEPSVS
jgi:hypothetical protein